MDHKPARPSWQQQLFRPASLTHRRKAKPILASRGARFELEEVESRVRIEALARVAARLTLQLDLTSVLSTVCEQASRALQAPGACIFLADSLGMYKLAARTDNLADRLPAELPRHPQAAALADQFTLTCQGWQVIGLAELQQDSRSVGYLCILCRDGDRRLCADEIALLQVFANQSAAAIANARLFEQVQAGRNRLQALSRQLVEVQETERRNIARELHDEIGQTLTGLKFNLEMLHHVPVSELFAGLEDAERLVQQLLAQVRQISLDLRPSMLDDLGLLPALLWLIDHYSSQTRVRVDFRHSGIDRRFPPAVETTAYRIVQEALTNVARHAGTEQATVRLWCSSETLGIQIEDQGRGFAVSETLAAGTSSGLAGMRERALLAGGRLVIDSSPGAGVCLTAELPLEGRLERRENDRHDLTGG